MLVEIIRASTVLGSLSTRVESAVISTSFSVQNGLTSYCKDQGRPGRVCMVEAGRGHEARGDVFRWPRSPETHLSAGDVSPISMSPISQSQFIPLGEILCLAISAMNSSRKPVTQEALMEHLTTCFPGNRRRWRSF